MLSRNPDPTAAAFMPDTLTMAALRGAVRRCRGCPLYADATLVDDLRLVRQTFAA